MDEPSYQTKNEAIGGMSGYELPQRTAVEPAARGLQLGGETLGLFEHVVGNRDCCLPYRKYELLHLGGSSARSCSLKTAAPPCAG